MYQFTPDDMRLLGMCQPLLVRMLKTREETIIKRIYGAFRNGETEHLAGIAEIACIRDQLNEINTALAVFNKEKTP